MEGKLFLDDIAEKAKSMDDASLERIIKTNREDFREGVYEIYIDEYEARGNIYKEIDIEQFKKSKKNAEEYYYNWVKAGYLFAFLGGLLGVIIAFYIKPKKNEENTDGVKYRRKQFWIIIMISVIMAFFVWPLVKVLIRLLVT